MIGRFQQAEGSLAELVLYARLRGILGTQSCVRALRLADTLFCTIRILAFSAFSFSLYIYSAPNNAPEPTGGVPAVRLSVVLALRPYFSRPWLSFFR